MLGMRTAGVAWGLWGWMLGTTIGLGCGDAGGGEDAMCVPGMQVSCGCPGETQGVQVCSADGTFYEVCQCGDVGDGSGDDGSGSSTGDDAAEGTGETGDLCGNGFPDPGEYIDDPPACPADCEVTGDSSGGDETTTGESSCVGMPIFALSIPNVASAWEFQGITGFGAGNMMCAGMGADHVCDYEEVLAAEAQGDFAAMAAGTTAWLHRTTPANGSAPGPGGRCIDWTYSTNHISDGEFVEFGAAGAVTYHIDNDTIYDPAAPGVHTQMGLLECGSQQRAILCCNPECVGEG